MQYFSKIIEYEYLVTEYIVCFSRVNQFFYLYTEIQLARISDSTNNLDKNKILH